MRKWIFTLLLCFWFPVSGVESPCIEVDLESLGILRPGMVAVHSRELYVFDDAGGCIHWIREGKTVKTFGSRGRGPDQYLRPARMITVNHKELWVSGPERNVIFTLDGEWLRTQRTRDLYQEMKKYSSDYVSVSDTVHISGEDWILGQTTTFRKGEIVLTLFFLRDGRSMPLIKYRKSLKNLSEGHDSNADPLPMLTVGKNNVYMVHDPRVYKVGIFHTDSERLDTGICKEDGPRIAFSKKQVEDFKRENEKTQRKAREAGGIPREFMDAISQADLPEYQPAITRICADEQERLYILSPTEDWGHYQVGIYREGQRFIREITVKCDRPLFLKAEGGKVMIIDETKDSYYLYIYCLEMSGG